MHYSRMGSKMSSITKERRPMEYLVKLIQKSTPIWMDGNSLIFLTEDEMSVMNFNIIKKEVE